MLALVDDAHWLDTPSADALLFVARRLDVERIVLLFATRDGLRRFDAPDLPVLELGASRLGHDRPMRQPLSELDTRFSDRDAVATDREETRRAFEESVGTFGQTRRRFRGMVR